MHACICICSTPKIQYTFLCWPVIPSKPDPDSACFERCESVHRNEPRVRLTERRWRLVSWMGTATWGSRGTDSAWTNCSGGPAAPRPSGRSGNPANKTWTRSMLVPSAGYLYTSHHKFKMSHMWTYCGGKHVECHFVISLCFTVLFNNALNTFYLWLYGIRHMVKDHSDSEKGNPLSPHRLLLSINSKGSFICTIP